MSPRIGRATAILALASLPAVLGNQMIGQAAALWTLAEPTGLYWGEGHLLLLWVGVPAVLASTMLLFLSPGILLALATGRATTLPALLLSAVPFAIGIATINVVVTSQLLPYTETGRIPGVLALLSLAACGAVAARAASRGERRWPDVSRSTRGAFAVTAVAIAVLYIVLMPKLFWENVNGDGAQAFEVSRLLLRQPWPFFPASVGPLSHFPDMTSLLFAYPNAWFMRLFGELDVAVRLPFLLYLLLLAIGIQAVAEERGREVGPQTMTAIWLGLITFALAMAFSATYSPYSADIALPAPRETLLMLCFVGFVHAMIRRDMHWVGGFGLLTYTTLPTGLLLMVLWLAAEAAVMRPIPTRVVSRAAATLLGCIVLGIATKMILVATGQPPPGVELGPERAFRGLLRLNISEWRRIVYALVACGIFPFVALAVWRRQDDVARRVTLVTLAYLAFFYVQSRFALHHLVPAMVLPAIVAARLRPEPAERRQRWLWAWQGLAILSVWLSLPASFEIERTSRRVGMAGVQQVGDYRAGDLTALRAGSLLQALFPFEWDPDVPERSYGGSALAWQRYTRQGPVDRQAVFVLAPIGADGSHPRGRQLATADGNALYILDEHAWLGLRNVRSRVDRHAKVYEIPQSTLFGAETENIIDLRDYGRRLKHLLVGPPTP